MTLGLTSAEAARLLALQGRNELRGEERASRLRMLARQYRSPLVALLGVGAIIAQLSGGTADALAILAILVLNGVVGYLQESRAEKALEALRGLTAPRARVLRDGRASVVPAAEIVLGDVLLLEAGDVIAADATLLEEHALTTQEAALTGESLPTRKHVGIEAADAPLAERHGTVFLGTSVATGTASALVFATGMATQVGRVAQLLESASSGVTPLQRQLAQLGRALTIACSVIVVLVLVAGSLRGQAPLEMLLVGVALAVAAVPEGLPAIVTIALAIGVERMASRNVLVRQLAAVETLGAVNVICTDKTGTLTTGVMAVRETWGPDRDRLLRAAASCCDAELDASGDGGVGDPTELAILAAAAERGIERSDIEAANPRTRVRPFDPATRSMSVTRADGITVVKGAVEVVFARSAQADGGDAARAAADMASRGLRVLAVGVTRRDDEGDLELVGLLGMADPPRTEAIEAIEVARAAGIRTLMITGDHAITAGVIAREMGIVRAGENAAELVHARATPEDKLRIVREWKGRGAVVAMTGDGVNDAPALQEAHVGIAMGITGTEVTRGAADMVLADDNFASIVAGVREGRGVQANIRKAIVYLLAGNVGELMLMAAAVAFALPLPLLPLHLLWINLVTDGLPALALVMDPASPTLMKAKPRDPHQPLIGRAEWWRIALVGALSAAVTLAVFAWALRTRSLVDARDLAFSTLVLSELFRALAARDPHLTYWQTQPLRNLRLVAVVALSVLLQIGIHEFEFTREVLGLGELSLRDCALVVVFGAIPVSIVEIGKLLRRA